MSTQKMVIALAGLGTVGSGLVKLLNDNAVEIERRTGKSIFLKWIAVRDTLKNRDIPEGTKLTTSLDDILNDDEVEVVVEVMGGIDVPQTLIRKALQKGKSVVTANKALLAEKGEDLFHLAEDNNLCLAYEASVAGAIPIVQTLKDSLAGNKIKSVVGILNGTSNYILSQMTAEGSPFADALQSAQELGFAEADPTLDIDGQDAAHKLKLLIRLAWGVHYPFEDLKISGIRNTDPLDILFAKELGYAIKLIGQADCLDNKIQAEVAPCLVPHTAMIARVEGAFNAIRVEGNAVGSLFLHGLGAGSLPTASAVLGDLMSLMRDTHDNTGYYSNKLPLAETLDSMESVNPWYLRLTAKDDFGVLRDIAAVFAEFHISLAQVVQKKETNGIVPLVFMTHATSALSIAKTLDKLKASGMILPNPIAYKVLDHQ